MVVGKEKTEEEGDRGKGCGWSRLPPIRLAGKAGTGGGGEPSNGWLVTELKRARPGRRESPVTVLSSSLSTKPRSSSSSSKSRCEKSPDNVFLKRVHCAEALELALWRPGADDFKIQIFVVGRERLHGTIMSREFLGRRRLFSPHSAHRYVALVLKVVVPVLGYSETLCGRRRASLDRGCRKHLFSMNRRGICG